MTWISNKCCVFRPANECSVRRLLVKIIFDTKNTFSVSFLIKWLKNAKMQKVTNKHVSNGGLPAFLLHVFVCFYAIFFLFSVSDRKLQKTCFNTKTNDFNQQMACVRWSKYTSNKVINQSQEAVPQEPLNSEVCFTTPQISNRALDICGITTPKNPFLPMRKNSFACVNPENIGVHCTK